MPTLFQRYKPVRWLVIHTNWLHYPLRCWWIARRYPLGSTVQYYSVIGFGYLGTVYAKDATTFSVEWHNTGYRTDYSTYAYLSSARPIPYKEKK